MNSIGFPSTIPMRSWSPALRRQVALLTTDKAADYYLFSDLGQPVRVVLDGMHIKLNFRICRSNAWSRRDQNDDGMAAIGQHLIKLMERKPGLSRVTILKQFDREYGEGSSAKIEELEKQRVEGGHGEVTFLEMMGKNSASIIPNDGRSFS